MVSTHCLRLSVCLKLCVVFEQPSGSLREIHRMCVRVWMRTGTKSSECTPSNKYEGKVCWVDMPVSPVDVAIQQNRYETCDLHCIHHHVSHRHRFHIHVSDQDPRHHCHHPNHPNHRQLRRYFSQICYHFMWANSRQLIFQSYLSIIAYNAVILSPIP